MRLLISKANAGDGYEDMQYAILRLTALDEQELLALCRAVWAAALPPDALYGVQYLRSYVTFHQEWYQDDTYPRGAEWRRQIADTLDADEWAALSPTWQRRLRTTAAAATSADGLVIKPDGVIFTAYHRHAERPVEVETVLLRRRDNDLVFESE